MDELTLVLVQIMRCSYTITVGGGGVTGRPKCMRNKYFILQTIVDRRRIC
jgi:hypothetical protein